MSVVENLGYRLHDLRRHGGIGDDSLEIGDRRSLIPKTVQEDIPELEHGLGVVLIESETLQQRSLGHLMLACGVGEVTDPGESPALLMR